MARTGYSASTGTAVALLAATPKSVLGVLAPASFGVDLTGYTVSFNGSAAATPVFIEICYSSFATNPPGTNSTTVTVQQTFGRPIPAGFTAARDWSSEPTVLTPLTNFWLTPNSGLVINDLPDGFDSDVADGFVFRMTAPANVSTHLTLLFGRC